MTYLLRRPRAFWISASNLVGLMCSLIGVVLLFWYALPVISPARPIGFFGGSEGLTELQRYNRNAHLGLALVLIGTVLEAVPPSCTALGSGRRRRPLPSQPSRLNPEGNPGEAPSEPARPATAPEPKIYEPPSRGRQGRRGLGASARQRSMLSADRVLIGLAASSGIVLAACVSGLPSTNCTALVQTYNQAIHGFGSVAVLSLLFILIGSMPRRPYLIWTLAIGAIANFVLAFGASAQNLRLAVDHCYIGTDEELHARRHQRIDVFGLNDVRVFCVFHLPYCGGR
jgi:hypothetical protein